MREHLCADLLGAHHQDGRVGSGGGQVLHGEISAVLHREAERGQIGEPLARECIGDENLHGESPAEMAANRASPNAPLGGLQRRLEPRVYPVGQERWRRTSCRVSQSDAWFCERSVPTAPPGVSATLRPMKAKGASTRLRTREIRFVLHRPKRSENIGAAARALANTGAGGLWLVAPQAWDAEAAAKVATRGARHVLDRMRVEATLDDALAGCVDVVMTSGRAVRGALDPRQAAQRLLEVPGPVALVFGDEANGLDKLTLRRAAATTTIPTVEKKLAQPRAGGARLCLGGAAGGRGGALACGAAAPPRR